MAKRKKKTYSEAFKEDAVRKVLKSNESISHIAAQLGVSQPTLSTWVKERSKSAATQVTGDEWEELKRLRKENARLKQEREILAKATAFFANRK